MTGKIGDLNELALMLRRLKDDGKKIILCHGVFDLLHPGHIRHFKEAKTFGDILVVTVTPDCFVDKGPGRPVFPQKLRAESIAALECVDYVAINDAMCADDLIRRFRPDIFVKGMEFKNDTRKQNPKIYSEREAIEAVGGEIRFTDDIVFSSSSLVNEYFGTQPEETRNYIKVFRERYSIEEIAKTLDDLKSLKVLLIGEAIIDDYHFVSVMGKSPKGTHIASEFVDQEQYAGGVLACANHLAGFCDKIDVVTAVGRDGGEAFIKSKLRPNITPILFHYKNAPTIIKRRFIDNVYLNKLFEIYIFNGGLAIDLEKEVADYIVAANAAYDLILVTDYGHGFFTPKVIDALCNNPCFLAVNAQSNTASLGFNPITKYEGADYYCLGEPEIHLAFQDKHADIPALMKLLVHFSPGMVAVTRGPKGSILYDSRDGNFVSTPALSQKVVDTVGAGDAFLSLTAACAAAKLPKNLIGFIGNVAGSLAITILGNKSPVEPEQIKKFITALLK